MSSPKIHFRLTPKSNQRLAILCGQFDENLKQVEKYLNIEIQHRGHDFYILGEEENCNTGKQVVTQLYLETAKVEYLAPEHIRLCLQQITSHTSHDFVIHTKSGAIKPLSEHQREYLKKFLNMILILALDPQVQEKHILL